MVAVAAVLGGALVLGGVFESGTARPDVPTTPAPTAAPATTAGPTTTSTVAPEDLLVLADEAWVEVRGRFSSEIDSTGVALTEGIPIAAVLDPAAGTLSVWEFDTDTGWSQADLLPVDWGDYIGADRLLVQDLTGDGSAEVFMNFYPTNDNFGVVFMLRDTGWVDVVGGQALDVTDDGVLQGYEETCRPNCAEGPYIPYRLRWSGSAFVRQDYDSFGNPAEYYISTPCPKPYNRRTSAPFVRCDTADGVKVLQEALIHYGFLWASEADGFFGPDTETAVRIYQLQVGVPVNGIVDGNWYYSLIESYNYDVFGGWGD